MLIALGLATLALAPANVARPVDEVAQATDRANDSIAGWARNQCARQRGQEEAWACPVAYTMADSTIVRVTYRVEHELTRRRHNGRWAGPWKRTRRYAVTDFTIASR